MENFWKYLEKPFFALAPMEDVTDTVFRELVAQTSGTDKLHLLFTEFMSVDGFLHDMGREKVKHRLFVSDSERQVLKEKNIRLVAQIWGSDPEKFYRAAGQIADEYEFDGIDINMGCPVKKIVKNMGCSALIRVPELAKEIVLATMEGSKLPVSVKTRIGFNSVDTENWIGHLLDVNPAAITIHGRTQKMQSEGVADWNEVRKAVDLRNSRRLSASGPGSGSRPGSETLILGNGDVSSYEDGLKRAAEYQTDGIMIGRGIFANPAFFSENETLNLAEKMTLIRNHIFRFNEVWDEGKNYAILKRFFKIYLNSFEGATQLRAKMMETNSCEEGLRVISEYEELVMAI